MYINLAFSQKKRQATSEILLNAVVSKYFFFLILSLSYCSYDFLGVGASVLYHFMYPINYFVVSRGEENHTLACSMLFSVCLNLSIDDSSDN